jgi:hypothetical protein
MSHDYILSCNITLWIFQHRNGINYSTQKLDDLTNQLNQEVENNQLMFNELAYEGYDIH